MKNVIEIGTLELNRAIAAASDKEVRGMLAHFAELQFQIQREPETGLIMQTVRDSFETDFHLGEILVTVAEVMLDDKRGWAMVMGDNGDRALMAACLDAVLSGDDSTAQEDILRELSKWLDRSENMIVEESKIYGTTRVNFESMAEE